MALFTSIALGYVKAHPLILALAFIGSYILYTIISAVLLPCRSVPGPLLARFTRLWYLRRVRLGHFHLDNIALHRKYGE